VQRKAAIRPPAKVNFWLSWSSNRACVIQWATFQFIA
jgi:hypothetical protein